MTTLHRRLAAGLFVLTGLLAANSLLGPLAFEVIEYRFSETLINQGIGLDFVALVALVPVAIGAGVLVLRGHRAGPVLAFIPAAFTAYMAPQYVVGPEYLDLPGNNEQFFLFHLAMFVLAVVLVITAWRAIDRDRLVPATHESDRRRVWVLLGVAAFIAIGRWLPAVIDLVSGDPTLADYLENPTSYLLIGLLDLGLVVPAAITAAIGLRRGAAWARTAAYGVIGWFALAPASIAGMAWAMQISDDPNASAATAALFTIAAVAFTTGAIVLYRPLFHAESQAETTPAESRHTGAVSSTH